MPEKRRQENDEEVEEGLLKTLDKEFNQHQERRVLSYASSPVSSASSLDSDTIRTSHGYETRSISMDNPRKWTAYAGKWTDQGANWTHNWRLNAISHFRTSSWRRLTCLILAVLSAFVLVLVLVVSAGSGYDESTLSEYKLPFKKPVPVTAETASCTTWSDSEELPTFTADQKRQGPAALNVTKPHDFEIIGLVFYGRPRSVDILDCYLQQNLAANGGLLDAVHFVAHTDDVRDLKWLDDLVRKTPGYKRLNVPRFSEYNKVWAVHGSDLNTMYIKIDDDITWFDKDAIPRLVQSRIEYEEPFVIAANLINSPVTSWLHQRMEAVYPYLPERAPTVHRGANHSWRASELPSYHDQVSNEPAGPDRVNSWSIPFEGHRWLPLRERASDIWKTPINAASPMNWSPAWKSWAIAAQQHMSLLQNIEKDELWRYKLEHNDYMLNTQYRRYNLNFVAVWGADIAANLPFVPDDEEALTQNIPRKLGRPLLIDTRVLVGHFSFYTQSIGMAHTDILDRYRAYANEAICTADNQKVPLDRPCVQTVH